MMKMTSVIRVAGIILIVLGSAFLSPLMDLLPVGILDHIFNPFEAKPRTVYYRVVFVEPSHWLKILMIVGGVVLVALSNYLRQRK